jgi:hypothetical protein
MSEINRALQDQQAKDVGEAFKEIFGNIPVIDHSKEKLRFLQDRIAEEQQKARAERP